MADELERSLAALVAPQDEEPPPDLAYDLFVCETKTGRVVESGLPFVGVPRWSFGINSAGVLDVGVPIDVVGKDTLRQLIDPWRFSWGLAWGDFILQCGPVVDAQHDDDSTDNVLSVGASGMWELLNHRLLVNAAWSKATKPVTDVTADLNITGKTLHDIARTLVSNDLARWGTLPIILPGTQAAGTDERGYPGFDLAMTGVRLAELTQVQDGPEVEFRPQFTDATRTSVQWSMLVGSPRLGNLQYPHAWRTGGAMMSLSSDHDGSQLLTEDWVRGNGMERGLLVGHAADATLEAAGWPHLDNVNGDHTSAIDKSTLDGWAIAEINTYGRVMKTLKATVRMNGADLNGRRTGSPPITEVSAGDNAVIDVVGHRWLPDQVSGQRIISVSNGSSLSTAQLTLQATGATG